jgi:hypothetical protein
MDVGDPACEASAVRHWHKDLGELAERAGHARPSMSLDVYSHVMPPTEVASERFVALLARRRVDTC